MDSDPCDILGLLDFAPHTWVSYPNWPQLSKLERPLAISTSSKVLQGYVQVSTQDFFLISYSKIFGLCLPWNKTSSWRPNAELFSLPKIIEFWPSLQFMFIPVITAIWET
jgi:hypothetical protein